MSVFRLFFASRLCFRPTDWPQVEGRGVPLHQGPLPATAAAVRRPAGDAGVGAGPAGPSRPAPLQQDLLRQRRLG